MFSCRPKTHMHQKCKCPSMLETKQTTKQQDSFVSTYKYRNGLLPMQYVFLIRSSAGCEKYVTRRRQQTVSIFIVNLHAIFNDILRKNHGTVLYCDRSAALRQWASLSWGVFLISVRPMGSTPFNASYYAWTFMNYWLLFTFLVNVLCRGNHLSRTESFISASAN